MRIRCLLLAAGVVSGSLALCAAPPSGESAAYVDDRGVAINAPLTARLLAPPSGVTPVVEHQARLELPKEWAGLVEIEGEGYGPIRITTDDLRSRSGTIVLPRKAVLRVGQPGAGTTSLAYFAVTAGTLVRIGEREVTATAVLKVPSGTCLFVAKDREAGEDFRLLSLLPGSTTEFVPKFSHHFAALLRVQRLADGTPVARATVQTALREGAEGAEPGARRLCQSDSAGLCLVVSNEPHLSAVIEAEGLVAIRSQFALEAGGPREIETVKMAAGARPMLQVLLDGEPAKGVSVHLRQTGAAASSGPPGQSKVYSGNADDQGRWRPGVVPPGAWIVRIRPEKGQPPFERRIELGPGSSDLLEINLERIRVTGALSRGKKGVAGAALVIAPRDGGEKSYSTANDAKEQEIVTDSDGEFEAFVWRAGLYDIFAGGLARKTVSVPKTGARVLLQVAESDLVCVVVDSDGHPIPSASVTIKEAEQDQSWTKTMKTDSEGMAAFSVRSGSEITVFAAAVGFKRSGKVTSSIPEEGVVTPVTLRLERDSVLTGRFVGQMGLPIRQADLWATSPAGEILSSSSATDGDGRFEVSRAGGREFTLFFVSAEAALTIHSVYDVGQNEEIVFAPTERGILEVQFIDSKGAPIAARAAVLERSGVVIQPALLARHLALRGLAAYSDARGTLLVSDLPSGDYSVIVSDVASPDGSGPLRAKVFVAPGRNSVRFTIEELSARRPF